MKPLDVQVTAARTDRRVGEVACYAAALVSVGALMPELMREASSPFQVTIGLVAGLMLAGVMTALGLAVRGPQAIE